MRLAADYSSTWRRSKHLSWRSRWIILCTLERRMTVSRAITRADQCLFGLSSWLSTRSSTATRWMQSAVAWLQDNCTRLADSYSADYRCFKFPTLVGQFTPHPSSTILLWQIKISQVSVKLSWFCLIFTDIYVLTVSQGKVGANNRWGG